MCLLWLEAVGEETKRLNFLKVRPSPLRSLKINCSSKAWALDSWEWCRRWDLTLPFIGGWLDLGPVIEPSRLCFPEKFRDGIYLFRLFFLLSFCLFRATLAAHGGSPARGPIGTSLHHSSWQHQILDPPSKARDWTCILIDSSRVRYHWATTGTPAF